MHKYSNSIGTYGECSTNKNTYIYIYNKKGEKRTYQYREMWSGLAGESFNKLINPVDQEIHGWDISLLYWNQDSSLCKFHTYAWYMYSPIYKTKKTEREKIWWRWRWRWDEVAESMCFQALPDKLCVRDRESLPHRLSLSLTHTASSSSLRSFKMHIL